MDIVFFGEEFYRIHLITDIRVHWMSTHTHTHTRVSLQELADTPLKRGRLCARAVSAAGPTRGVVHRHTFGGDLLLFTQEVQVTGPQRGRRGGARSAVASQSVERTDEPSIYSND